MTETSATHVAAVISALGSQPEHTAAGDLAAQHTRNAKAMREIAQGIDAAPEAFLGLLKGRNFGKQVVKLV